MNLKYALLPVLLGITGSALAQSPSFITDSLDRYIQQAMTDWQVPSLAVGIVQNGKIIKATGYGTTARGQLNRVDAQTLFPIGSNTKLFIATGLAQLAQQKKIQLDDPVITHLPSFRMFDDRVTPVVSIRDLLSHRLGLTPTQNDFLIWDTKLSRAAIVEKLAKLKPTYPFRQQFGYSNTGYVAAGEVITAVTGRIWEHYIDSTLLKPLGMGRTYFDLSAIKTRTNLAKPYSTGCSATGQLTELPFDSLANIGAATGMVSCLDDMNRWLLMQLDSGRVNGNRILPWSVLQTTRQPTAIISTDPIPGFPIGVQLYSLGTGIVYYANQTTFIHTGTTFGYRSAVCFVPAKNMGFVILSNQDTNKFFEALLWQILDAYLQVPYTNRSAYFLKNYQRRMQKQIDTLTAYANRVSAAKTPALPWSAFAGTYTNSLYGKITIRRIQSAGDRAALDVYFEQHTNLRARLDYMDGNEFRLTFSNPRFGITPAVFTTSAGGVKSLTLKATDFLDDAPYQFDKQ